MSVLIKQEIGRNGIGRLSELFDEWLKENQKAKDEPLTPYELATLIMQYGTDGENHERRTDE